MSTQLLIYKTLAPVNTASHRDWSIEVGTDFAFSSAINSVPLMAVEFPLAANEYPIVFGGTAPDLIPAAILGVQSNENLFLRAGNKWDAAYIPAFLRRYPFVFSHDEGRFVLCIDEAFSGFNREGRGQRLFNDDSTQTPYVDGVLTFLQDYQTQFLATQRFCARIGQLGLLEPMEAQVTMNSGARMSLGGFMAVNREKLKALPAETLGEMAKNDELEMLYLHLHSLRNFDRLRDMAERRQAG
ncbi:MAG: multidrug transporter [Acetobacteraceae bacterium]|nr:multidrug transporter [Acetobacteraceae bacterium]